LTSVRLNPEFVELDLDRLKPGTDVVEVLLDIDKEKIVKVELNSKKLIPWNDISDRNPELGKQNPNFINPWTDLIRQHLVIVD
jgi:hypothetical protein